jgi:hypothetical protein
MVTLAPLSKAFTPGTERPATDGRRAARRQPCRQRRDNQQHGRHEDEQGWIARRDIVQIPCQHSQRDNGTGQTKCQAGDHGNEMPDNDQTDDLSRSSPDRNPDTDLPRLLRNRVSDDAMNAHDGEQQTRCAQCDTDPGTKTSRDEGPACPSRSFIGWVSYAASSLSTP